MSKNEWTSQCSDLGHTMTDEGDCATCASGIYYRITEFSDTFHCDEPMAVCPDCGEGICVFCEDSCANCGDLF